MAGINLSARARVLLLTFICAGSIIPFDSCMKTPRRALSLNDQGSFHNSINQVAELSNATSDSPRLNINMASAVELEKLPGIGKALAARIIEHREQYGRFRRAEHLLMVRGISEPRFRAMRALITVE
jgi:competence ComEA-like helix-hairpin-helix protein